MEHCIVVEREYILYLIYFILNYYNTHYQYKCAIAIVWGYGILYLQFGATLHVN